MEGQQFDDCRHSVRTLNDVDEGQGSLFDEPKDFAEQIGYAQRKRQCTGAIMRVQRG
jgi:hypothetical protein